jgi:hypothetical protein
MKRFASLLAVCGLGLLAFTAPAGTGDPAGVPVSGQMTITAINLSNHAILGQMTGDITGGRRIRIVDSDIILLPTGFATLLKGHGSIITEDGLLLTRDRIVLKRVTPGEPAKHWRGRHRIRGGTGEYAGYRGAIHTSGIVGPNAQPLTYEGELIPPTP